MGSEHFFDTAFAKLVCIVLKKWSDPGSEMRKLRKFLKSIFELELCRLKI